MTRNSYTWDPFGGWVGVWVEVLDIGHNSWSLSSPFPGVQQMHSLTCNPTYEILDNRWFFLNFDKIKSN